MTHHRIVPLLLLLLVVSVLAAAAPDVVRMSAKESAPSRRFSAEKGADAEGLLGRPDGHEQSKMPQLHKDWWQFKQRFSRVYANSKEEYERLVIFTDNMRRIRQHNDLADRGLKSYRLGVNDFADMTHAEFLYKMNGLRRHVSEIRRGSIAYISPATEQSLPDTVDWRQQGAVTPVKDQGQCGSCWAFSTTGSLEGQNFRKTGTLLSLSEQQLVDCAGGQYGNQGCNGGLMDNAFQYVEHFGIEQESDYPYVAEEGTCMYRSAQVAANCTGFVDIPAGSEAKLQEAVANIGPVSVAIDASNPSFQLYKSGVYNEPSCSTSQLDHGVLVVGYGTSGGNAYWLVKNSWNVTWGEQGYILMSRNRRNQCGIASMASYPTV